MRVLLISVALGWIEPGVFTHLVWRGTMYDAKIMSERYHTPVIPFTGPAIVFFPTSTSFLKNSLVLGHGSIHSEWEAEAELVWRCRIRGGGY